MNAQTPNPNNVCKCCFKQTVSQIIGYEIKNFRFVIKKDGVSAICRYKGWQFASKQETMTAALYGLRERIRYDEYMKNKINFN